jgi:hypothetical protein
VSAAAVDAAVTLEAAASFEAPATRATALGNPTLRDAR